MRGRWNELSILIVTWNGDEMLLQCLESLVKVGGQSAEVVVVDNAASPATERLVSQFANCKYVKAERNLGFSGGNNLGLAHCTRRYVLLLNNDTLVHTDSFSPLLDYLDRNPQVGVVQGTLVLGRDGGRLDSCGMMLSPLGGLYLRHWLESAESCELSASPVFSAKGAMLAFARSLPSEIPGGLFHGHFFNNYEEVDFCHRVWLSGREVHFVPTPPVNHLYNATIRRLPSGEVRARELSNSLFSLHSLLGFYGKARLLPLFYGYRFLMFIRCVCTFNWAAARVYGVVLGMTWCRRSELARIREDMRNCRRISDRELFRRTMIHLPFSYWLKFAKGWLCGKY